MLTSHETPIRVRLEGTLTRPAPTLTVLLSPEGRGIRIYPHRSYAMPADNTHVAVTGGLHFNDKGVPILRITPKDTITTLAPLPEPPSPRLVDFLAPSPEDACALVRITGMVVSTSKTSAIVSLPDCTVKVMAPHPAGLSVDIIGILDTSRPLPMVYPLK
jgi:hypothetical protein